MRTDDVQQTVALTLLPSTVRLCICSSVTDSYRSDPNSLLPLSFTFQAKDLIFASYFNSCYLFNLSKLSYCTKAWPYSCQRNIQCAYKYQRCVFLQLDGSIGIINNFQGFEAVRLLRGKQILHKTYILFKRNRLPPLRLFFLHSFLFPLLFLPMMNA